MEVPGVDGVVGGLVGAAEPEEVRGHNSISRIAQYWNHPPVQIRPGRLTVKTQHHWRVGRTFVDVVHPQTFVPGEIVDVVGLVRPIGEVGKGGIVCAQGVDTHARDPSGPPVSPIPGMHHRREPFNDSRHA